MLNNPRISQISVEMVVVVIMMMTAIWLGNLGGGGGRNVPHFAVEA
jgi:hypothetical protein